jgi:replicative DNA helicase
MAVFNGISEAGKSGSRISGLTTGFTKLDDLTAGMHPGQLIIVAGRPGMGKTTFAVGAALNAAHSRMHTGRPSWATIFSLEMSGKDLTERTLASEARIDSQRIRQGKLSADDWPALATAAGALSDMPVSIDDTESLSLVELRSKARRIHSERGLCLLVVDYLQLMRSGSKNESREQEISEISRGLKALAKELEIPIIALSQLNRAVENRADKRPQLSDLRESGAIEQDADTIWFVYRDEKYNPQSADLGIAEIIVGKQRAGATGTVRLRFTGEYTRFDNLHEREEEDFPQ